MPAETKQKEFQELLYLVLFHYKSGMHAPAFLNQAELCTLTFGQKSGMN